MGFSVGGETFGPVVAVAALASGDEDSRGTGLYRFVIGIPTHALLHETLFNGVVLSRH